MHLTYRELEDFLAEIHMVAASKRTALKGRLKHFQRLGWPAGTNKGKGARVNYGVGQTFSLAMGFEMLQLGLTPEKVIEQLRLSGDSIARGFAAALQEYGPDPDPIYYIFSPESLYALRDVEGPPEGYISLMISQSELSGSISRQAMFRMPRLAMINITLLLEGYVDHFIGKGLGSPENLQAPIENWRKFELELLKRQGWQVFEGDDGSS